MFHLFFCTRMSQVFQTHVSSVSSIFFCMLQLLHLDVSKVDLDVAHIAIVFQLYVSNISSVLDVCCKCFICMLQKWIGVLHGVAIGGHCAGCRSLRRTQVWVIGCGTQDTGCDVGAAQVLKPRPNVTSHPDIRAPGVPFDFAFYLEVDAFIFLLLFFIFYFFFTFFIVLYVAPSSHKRMQLWEPYVRTSRTSSCLTRFIVNNISIFVSK
jgi:hypothetical protein